MLSGQYGGASEGPKQCRQHITPASNPVKSNPVSNPVKQSSSFDSDPHEGSTEMVDLAQFVANRASRVKNPSPRTPSRSTEFNNADNVSRQLAEDSHQIWGWVIYRCTYDSPSDWTEFINRLNFYIHSTLTFDNGLDMLESLDYHVFDDCEKFDGAHPADVRGHFREWVVTAPQREQQGPDASARRSQRYNYCLHVDREALESVLAGPAPPGDELGDGFVNLVCLETRGGMRPEYNGDEREQCWMRIEYHGLMLGWYSQFRQPGSWFTEYRPPPQVAHL